MSTVLESGSVAAKTPLSPVVIVSKLSGISVILAFVEIAVNIGASLRPLMAIDNSAVVL